jgi:uncharacterized membrane protein
MRTTPLTIAFSGVLALLATACSYHRDKDPSSLNDNTSAADGSLPLPTPTENLSFELIKQKIFIPKCLKCHNADESKVRLDVLSYQSITERLKDIEQTVIHEKSMPKKGHLSVLELNLLTAWIQAGAPEFEGSSGASPEPHPAPDQEPPVQAQDMPNDYHWARVEKLVFERSCLKCHAGTNTESKPNLLTIKNVRKNIDRILDQVFILEEMPPKKDLKLTKEQLDALLKWVRYGMPE